MRWFVCSSCWPVWEVRNDGDDSASFLLWLIVFLPFVSGALSSQMAFEYDITILLFTNVGGLLQNTMFLRNVIVNFFSQGFVKNTKNVPALWSVVARLLCRSSMSVLRPRKLCALWVCRSTYSLRGKIKFSRGELGGVTSILLSLFFVVVLWLQLLLCSKIFQGTTSWCYSGMHSKMYHYSY